MTIIEGIERRIKELLLEATVSKPQRAQTVRTVVSQFQMELDIHSDHVAGHPVPKKGDVFYVGSRDPRFWPSQCRYCVSELREKNYPKEE